jgi:cell division septal protein FtsQ
MSSGIIDLRPRKGGRKPPAGQRPLFSQRPALPPRRPLPLRARRRRARLGLISAILAAVALFLYGVHWVSYLPALNIQQVTVTGAEQISPQLIADYTQTVLQNGSFHFLSRSNILLYPRAVIERDIVADFPRVASAKVSRDSLFGNVLNVAITERKPYALWCDDKAQCYDMDDGGFVFAPSAAHSPSGYTFQGGLATSSAPVGQRFEQARLPNLVTLLTELGQAGFSPQGAIVQNDTDFEVPLEQGFAVKATFGESPDVVVKNLQLVLRSDPLQGKSAQLEYIDLRFGDRVYYKLKGETQATSTPQ